MGCKAMMPPRPNSTVLGVRDSFFFFVLHMATPESSTRITYFFFAFTKVLVKTFMLSFPLCVERLD